MNKINWQLQKGQRLIDYNEDGSIKRDITIIDKKIVKTQVHIKKENRKSIKSFKYYKYKCNLCGFDSGKHWLIKDREYKEELWSKENHLLKGMNCSCCKGTQIVVENINSIYKTDPWMIPYIGEEIAKTHTHSSNDKVKITCPDCGRILKNVKKISHLYENHSIGCNYCDDGISYPEKFMFSVLEQLKINFKTQLSKTTFKWCHKYRYDFYFEYNNEQYIIETHGLQHYEEKTINSKFISLGKQQKIDRIKKELALSNGIKEKNYIFIDCRKSTLDWIKNNNNGILKSRLSELFDLKKIDWLGAEKFTTTNLVKQVCDLKYSNPNITTSEISSIVKYTITTIINWLKKGKILGLCNYDSLKEMRKNGCKNGKSNGIPLIILKNNEFLNVYLSTYDLERNSFYDFGIKLFSGSISYACLGKIKQYKGYIIKYIKDLTPEEYIKYNIENKLKELHNEELVQAC